MQLFKNCTDAAVTTLLMGVHRNQWCNRIFWLLILIVFIWLHPEHAVFLHMINNIWHCSSPLCIPSIPAAINSMYGKETRKPIRYGVGWPKICGSIPNMGTRFFPPKYPGLSPGPTHPFPCAVAVTNLSSVVQSTCNTKLTTHHLRLHYKRMELLFQSQIPLCRHGLNA